MAANLISLAADAAGNLNPADLSIQHLIGQADPVVKVVMGILGIFSLVSWTVIFQKLFSFKSSLSALDRLETTLETGTAEDMLNYADEHEVAEIIKEGNKEWRSGSGDHSNETLAEGRERIEHSMRLQLAVETRRLNKSLPFLATIGSAGPFIGLFGTVWGIMNTFTGIAGAHDTSLATVAPGIAEALIATGIGLAAAIPSIMAYNSFATSLGRYTGRLGTVIGIYANRLSKRRAPAARG